MNKNKTNEIIVVILDEMHKRGLSHRKMAQLIGVNYRIISYWKNGESGISLETADRALKALGRSVTLGEEK